MHFFLKYFKINRTANRPAFCYMYENHRLKYVDT